MVVELGHGARPEIRDWTDVEHRAAVGELPDEPGILLGADPVPEPVGLQALERAAYGGGAGDFARVRDRAQPNGLCMLEHRFVRLRRKLRLESAEPDAHDPAI